MRSVARLAWIPLIAALAACGGDDDNTTAGTGSESGSTSDPSTTGTTDDGTTAGPVGACVDEDGAEVFEHEGEIGDETWVAGVHMVTSNLTVTGLLKVEPCSVIKIAEGRTIAVRDSGAIEWIGTAELPILVTSAKPAKAPGDWNEIDIYASSAGPLNRLAYVTIEYGGDSVFGQLWVEDGASIEMRDCTVQQSGDFGMVVEGDAELRSFGGNTLIDNAAGPLRISPNHAGDLLAGTYSPNDVEGVVLQGDGVDKDQSWLAHDAPYVAPNGFRVQTDGGSAHLTVEAGAILRVGEGSNIEVRDNGGLTLAGTEAEPITVTSAKSVGAPGDWGQIEIYEQSADSLNDFDHVLIEHGGGSVFGEVWVEDGASLAITDSVIARSGDVGIHVGNGGALRDFTGNTLTENAAGPILLGADAVDSLGAGAYGPNPIEGIRVRAEYVAHDAAWANHGVPYVAEDGFDIGVDVGSARLTVAAGVTIRVGSGRIIDVRQNGALRLDGTADAHVIVTSAKPAPAPGDWNEIDINDSSIGPENVFRYADIEYGGGSVFGQLWVDSGAEVTLDNVTFTGSGGGCDVDENGAVNAMGTSYVMCM